MRHDVSRLPRHMPALDGMRGVAILLVVLNHVGAGWGAALSISQDTRGVESGLHLPDVANVIAALAFHGVQLFFVVSAFTLTARLSTGKQDWLGYACRRIARVGPAYWLAGIGYTLWARGAVQWAPDGLSAWDCVVAALFGSAWQGGPAMAVVPGGWSVSCEVAFYAGLPLVLWLARGKPWRAAMLTVISAVCVQLWARHLISTDDWTYPAFVHPLVQAPVFLCGITAALVAQRGGLPNMRILPPLLLAFAIGFLPLLQIQEQTLSNHIPFAALAAFAVALAAVDAGSPLAWIWLRRLGEVSYSLYLVHFSVLAVSLHVSLWLLPEGGLATMLCHFALTVALGVPLAWLGHRFVEQPGMAWMARRLRARAGVVASASSRY